MSLLQVFNEAILPMWSIAGFLLLTVLALFPFNVFRVAVPVVDLFRNLEAVVYRCKSFHSRTQSGILLFMVLVVAVLPF